MAKRKFLRRDWSKVSKIGRKRKNKQKWKKPTGRDNKMREKRKGYPAVVQVGYKVDKSVRGMLEGKMPIVVRNLADLKKLGKENIAIIGNIGQKKKIEVLKMAKENKIAVYNENVEKFLKKVEKKKSSKQIPTSSVKADEQKKKENKK